MHLPRDSLAAFRDRCVQYCQLLETIVVAGDTEILEQVLIRNPDLVAARKALFNFNNLLDANTPLPPPAPADDPPTSSSHAKRSRTHSLVNASTNEEQQAILPSPADMTPDDDRAAKRARHIAAAEERRRRDNARGIGDQEVVQRMQHETAHQTRTGTSQLFGASRAMALREAKDALKRKQEAEKDLSPPTLTPADLQGSVQVPPCTKRQRVTSFTVSATSLPEEIIDDPPIETLLEPVSLLSSATTDLHLTTTA